MDTSIPGSECVVELRYKNYEPYGNESITYRITAVPAPENGAAPADLFEVTVGGDQKLHIRTVMVAATRGSNASVTVTVKTVK